MNLFQSWWTIVFSMRLLGLNIYWDLFSADLNWYLYIYNLSLNMLEKWSASYTSPEITCFLFAMLYFYKSQIRSKVLLPYLGWSRLNPAFQPWQSSKLLMWPCERWLIFHPTIPMPQMQHCKPITTVSQLTLTNIQIRPIL